MNIILLMNDTFRRDHLGCYGNEWIATPHLDRFAQRSAVFDQYYIASYPTVPNRWDMLTGRFGFPTRGWEPLSGAAQVRSRSGHRTEHGSRSTKLLRDHYWARVCTAQTRKRPSRTRNASAKC